MRCDHCRRALSPTLATHDGRWPTKIQHAPSRNPPAPTTDDSSISALNPLQQPTVVANHRKSSTVVMAQERSGIAVGLNKGHVRCPVSFLCCVCWSILGLNLDFFLCGGQSRLSLEKLEYDKEEGKCCIWMAKKRKILWKRN